MNKVSCSFSTVRERDMDLFFLEAIASDPGFAQLLIDKTEYKGKDFKVLNVELSRTELDLGESDITVLMEINGQKIAFLIEDKVDAIAMPDQHQRYKKRGSLGVEKGEYKDYEIFIFCPLKYHSSNAEAKLYEHLLTYEECKEYFDSKDDVLSSIRSQQLGQAIERAKKPPEVNLNQDANAFFLQYRDYINDHYPLLDLRTSEKANGWWIHFGTRFGDAYIYHKTQAGYIDLTFPKASTAMDVVQNLSSWLRSHGFDNVTAVKTGKAAALRIVVPSIDITKPFDTTPEVDLKCCLDAVQELTDFANLLEDSRKIDFSKRS